MYDSSMMRRLLHETVKFLERCQTSVLTGNIELEKYYWLTRIKHDFVNNILECEDKSKFVDNELKDRIIKIRFNECFITYMTGVFDL